MSELDMLFLFWISFDSVNEEKEFCSKSWSDFFWY